jgi:hypothetical protein
MASQSVNGDDTVNIRSISSDAAKLPQKWMLTQFPVHGYLGQVGNRVVVIPESPPLHSLASAVVLC